MIHLHAPTLIVIAASVVTGLVVVAALVWSRRSQAPPKPRQTSSTLFTGTPGEKRTQVRRRGGSVDVVLWTGEQDSPSVKGRVIDRCSGGLGLVVDTEWPVETVLQVRPLNGGETVPWVQIEVRECVRFEDGWRLGCKFVRVPPYNVMMLFG